MFTDSPATICSLALALFVVGCTAAHWLFNRLELDELVSISAYCLLVILTGAIVPTLAGAVFNVIHYWENINWQHLGLIVAATSALLVLITVVSRTIVVKSCALARDNQEQLRGTQEQLRGTQEQLRGTQEKLAQRGLIEETTVSTIDEIVERMANALEGSLAAFQPLDFHANHKPVFEKVLSHALNKCKDELTYYAGEFAREKGPGYVKAREKHSAAISFYLANCKLRLERDIAFIKEYYPECDHKSVLDFEHTKGKVRKLCEMAYEKLAQDVKNEESKKAIKEAKILLSFSVTTVAQALKGDFEYEADISSLNRLET